VVKAFPNLLIREAVPFNVANQDLARLRDNILHLSCSADQLLLLFVVHLHATLWGESFINN